MVFDRCVDMFAVIGRGLFYEVAPDRFGSLGKAFFTLFQLITLDDWFFMYSDVVSKNPGQFDILSLFCFFPLLVEPFYTSYPVKGDIIVQACALRRRW